MNLKDDLIRKGYLPNNLPPSFTTEYIADYFLFVNTPPQDYYINSNERKIFQSATQNSSKRRNSRRIFSIIHPSTAHDLAQFIYSNWLHLEVFYASNGEYSLSIPVHHEDGKRALGTFSHTTLEQEKYSRLSQYKFIATTDISRFYHSIYTHSIPWAFHGKEIAKSDIDSNSTQVFFNKADAIIRSGQDGQTIGIPVGPDMSRVFAEVVGTAIDVEFRNRIGEIECTVLRYVDDVWIGVHSHADAEKALACYRSALREFELDINESKTNIFSEEFKFFDPWYAKYSGQIEQISSLGDSIVTDRMRAALEDAFSTAVTRKDDGILNFTLHCIHKSELSHQYWDVIEPFLKRLTVHFGHTIAFVVQILVLRYIRGQEVNLIGWQPFLTQLLNYHGSLGNDSEVCWLIYLHQILNLEFTERVAEIIVENCGALALLAVLNSVEINLIDGTIFRKAAMRIRSEYVRNSIAYGKFWPVYLEWKSREWPEHDQFNGHDEIIQEMSECKINIYDLKQISSVLDSMNQEDFEGVDFAIERISSDYDEDDNGSNVDENLSD